MLSHTGPEYLKPVIMRRMNAELRLRNASQLATIKAVLATIATEDP
jgi:hypothetical protein